MHIPLGCAACNGQMQFSHVPFSPMHPSQCIYVVQAKSAKESMLKSQLELLCRELQKENKRVSVESHRMAAMELEKREQLSSKFEASIASIKQKMDEESLDKQQRAAETDA